MSLHQISISQFRNLQQVRLDPCGGVNVLVGENGSGKSSVLEAIHCLGLGRSFRTSQNQRVIRYEQPEYVVFARDREAGQLGLRRGRNGDSELRIGGERAERMAQMAQLLPLQLIHPEGYNLLSGSAKLRRAFLDWGVFHVEPEFFGRWSRVRRLLRQRNALLKKARGYAELKYWDNELAQAGESIADMRREYLASMQPTLHQALADFLPEYAGEENGIDIRYFRGWDKQTPLAEQLEKQFERDRQLGYTTGGPHKADMRLRIQGIPVHDVLSRGQLKLAVCALRLSQGLYLSEHSDKRCVFLIDDFASELDEGKRARLAQYLFQSQAQVFVTAINLSQVQALMDGEHKVFHVKQGEIDNG